ncbi:MAG TPA: DUF4251 domain-containing protein [Flavisolibacter sp.]|jgi:hypothetical protein|nr:DUF4251 domain-containing protein [Flavisolibacter sp.]
MQKLLNILVKSLLVIILAGSSMAVHAQDLDKSIVQNFIKTKEFVFKAQTVLPMTGMSRQLTSDYDVRFLGDSVVAYLPYFGRAYSAGYGEGGAIDFTSTKFEYKVKERKKGGWDVSIKPKDAKDVQALNFTVSENGYASLQVTSNNRQPISYNGYVMERKRK